MEQFDTKEGKLFYTVYTMYKQNEINQEQRARLKDLIILQDPVLDELQVCGSQIRKSLIDLASNISENEDNSTRQTRMSPRLNRPVIQIGQSNFKLSSKSQRSLVSPLYKELQNVTLTHLI